MNQSQENHPLHLIMSSANSANIPSPTPSSFTINMDVAEALPVQPQADTPVVYKQDCPSIPQEVVTGLG